MRITGKKNFAIMTLMFADFPIKIHFSKTNLAVLAVLLFLLLYPYELTLGGVPLVNTFIKTRVVSLSILFLVLRGMIHDYYSPRLTILYLMALILAPTLTFGYLVLFILGGLILFKLAKLI